MVRVALLLLSLAVASTAAAAGGGLEQGELPVDLPELGSQRRVVMSKMRRAGFEMLSSKDDTLVFAGSPDGWPKATTTTYIFRGLIAEELRVEYIDVETRKRSNKIYSGIKARMSKWFGAPWLDRVPPPSDSAGPLRTTWENTALRAELQMKHDPLHTVSIAIKRSAHLQAKQEVESVKGDEMPYDAAASYIGLSTSVKEAAEILFDDFGEMDMVRESARAKGEPLKVALGEVSLPRDVKGVDETLIQRRFLQLTAGHWNLESSAAEDSDVEFRVALVLTSAGGKRVYSMRLDAFVDDVNAGTRQPSKRKKKIYSARHRLQ
ncbi:MAG: hypothetical protein AAFX94_13910 [Myxococcota bacterium]